MEENTASAKPKIGPRRIIMSVVGMSFLGVCVALLTKANLGVDPFTCFCTGIGNLFHSTYTIFFIIVTGIFLVAVFFLDKHYIGIATVLNLLLVSTVAKGFSYVIQGITPQTWWQQAIILLIALVLLCIASSMYICADLGVSSYDAMSLILSNRTHWQYRWCRIGTDLICIGVGWLCGGKVGVGTVFTAFFMGPFTQWCNKHIAIPLLGKEYVPHAS